MRTFKTLPTFGSVFAGLCAFVILGLFLPAGFTSVSVILLFIYSFFIYFLKKEKGSGTFILLLPIILLLLFIIGFAYSTEKKIAFELIIRKSSLLLLPLTFLFKRQVSKNEFNALLFLFLCFCLVCSFVCFGTAIYNIITHKTYIVQTPDRVYYYFAYNFLTDPVDIDPIYLSLFCNLAFIVSLTTPLINKPFIKIAVPLYIAFFIVMISSKIGVITLILTTILWICSRQARNKFSVIILLICIVLIIPISIYKFPFLKDRFSISFNFDYKQKYGHLWTSTGYRLAIWSSAIETIKESPIFGYGTAGGQKALENTYAKHEFVWGLRDSLNPHNEFFSTLLDVGIPGFCILLLIFALPLIRAMKEGDFLVFSFVMICLLFCLIESILLRQKGIIFFSFFYSFLLQNFTKES